MPDEGARVLGTRTPRGMGENRQPEVPPMEQWRVLPTGLRQTRGPNGTWYPEQPTMIVPASIPPPVAPHRQRPRGALPWVAGTIVVVILTAAAVGFAAFSRHDGIQPDRQQLQAQALAHIQGKITGVARVVCVMPSAWVAGRTFTCFAYGGSGTELAKMDGTVLPDAGGTWQANEQWAPTVAARPATSQPTASTSGSQTVATACDHLGVINDRVANAVALTQPTGEQQAAELATTSEWTGVVVLQGLTGSSQQALSSAAAVVVHGQQIAVSTGTFSLLEGGLADLNAACEQAGYPAGP